MTTIALKSVEFYKSDNIFSFFPGLTSVLQCAVVPDTLKIYQFLYKKNPTTYAMASCFSRLEDSHSNSDEDSEVASCGNDQEECVKVVE